MLRSNYANFTFLLISFGFFSQIISAQTPDILITQSDLSFEGAIEINNWKGIAGDNFSWLDDSLNYESWSDIQTNNISSENLNEWNGIGWFKTIITVDENLVNEPIPFIFDKNGGALELYLDGNLIKKLGSISSIAEDNISEVDHHAAILQIPDTLSHSLTVRFATHKTEQYSNVGLENGFQLTLFDYDEYILTEEQHEKEHTHIVLVIAFLASLSIIHLLLLVFYPAGQMNFYFTFVAASLAIFTLFTNGSEIFDDPQIQIISVYIKQIAWLVTYLCLLKFSYSFTEKSSPRSLVVILIVALVVTGISFLTQWPVEIARSVLSILILLEYSRIVLVQKNQKQPVDLLLIGIGVFLLMIFLSRDSFYSSFENGYPFMENMNAITVLIASLSFYLLRDFAKAQIKLEYKYLEVKHLSERSVDQERRNKEKEFKQKLLEAENERKTAELEEARALQLSMLPSEIPTSKFWDIAAKMETAYEVGGDYYDFYEANENELVAAIGDATGHGMKAGIIVATVKSNFLSTIGSNSLVDTLKKISAGIRNLELKMLYMGLMLFRIKKHQLTFTSAGMPQAFWFKSDDNHVQELLIKAMPLGTSVNFPYQERSFDAQKGDVILVVSDGLIELFNSKREQLGIDPIKKLLQESSSLDSKEILKKVFQLKKDWSNGAAQEDDVTILVMKAI
jgi:serine phosphatase RsbU (regulator of sigma subunit)